MSPPGPLVAVVVVQYGPEGPCEACLESIRRSKGVRVLPVLVDNSACGSAALRSAVEALGGIHLARPDNPGFAAGANAGLRAVLEAARPDVLAVLNADIRLAPDCLRILHAVLTSHPDAGIAGPGLLSEDDPERWWNVGGEVLWPSGSPRSWLHGILREGGPIEIRDTGFVCGSVLAFRPDLIERAGPLPERYFLYFEDAEFSLRARAAGFRTIVCPEALAWHRGGAAVEDAPHLAAYYRARNRLIFSRDWNPHRVRGRIHRALFALRALASSLVRSRAGLRREPPFLARAVLDYVLGRSGKGPFR
ncbi:MAG TPA: glycosyltransferase family 2 protein [Planctomycetota bacterium]|nr:glycosyltransferase family 2 protein [Planctomycetota bacterium]